MTNILDQIARTARISFSAFVPTSRSDIFGLRLAQKLGDISAARHYAELATVHSPEQLLVAFNRTARESNPVERARRFHRELESLRHHGYGHNGHRGRLAAIRLERRTIAVVILKEDVPAHFEIHHLPSVSGKVVGSAVGFIASVMQDFPFDSAVNETLPQECEAQRSTVALAIRQLLRERSIVCWDVPKPEIFASFGHPPLKSRKEVRQVIASIWPDPMLGTGYGSEFVKDAAALGLHVQTERLFIIN